MCIKNYRKQVKKGLEARGPVMCAIWDFFPEKHAGVTTSQTAFNWYGLLHPTPSSVAVYIWRIYVYYDLLFCLPCGVYVCLHPYSTGYRECTHENISK